MTGAWKVTFATMREGIGSSSRVAGAKRHARTPATAASAKGGVPSRTVTSWTPPLASTSTTRTTVASPCPPWGYGTSIASSRRGGTIVCAASA
jgi:hypothetical protein